MYRCFKYSTLISIGTIGVGVSYFLIGPCIVCDFPDQIWIIFVGLAMNGMFAGLMYVPLLAHMIDLATLDYEFFNDDALSDTLSGSVTFFTSCGSLFGPIVGGFLVEYWSFDHMFSLFGVFFICYGIFFGVAHLNRKVIRKITMLEHEDKELIESFMFDSPTKEESSRTNSELDSVSFS